MIHIEQKIRYKKIASDNDDCRIINTKENIEISNCTAVFTELKDNLINLSSFDIVLAIINRNVLIDIAGSVSSIVNPNGLAY